MASMLISVVTSATLMVAESTKIIDAVDLGDGDGGLGVGREWWRVFLQGDCMKIFFVDQTPMIVNEWPMKNGDKRQSR